MTPTQTFLNSLLSQEESEVLEFKAQAKPESIAPSIVSFLNGRGGTVVIGVSDTKQWLGVADVKRIQADLEAFLPAHIAPEATLRYEQVEQDGRAGLIIEVPPGDARPYVFGGAIYARRNATTVAASPREIIRLVEQRSREVERWERQKAVGIEIENLNRTQIYQTREAQQAKYEAYRSASETSVLSVLDRLDLATEGWPRNAAVVLFLDKSDRGRYPQLAIDATVLWDETLLNFADRRTFMGNAFALFDQAFDFVARDLPLRSHISLSDTTRKDYLALPPLVVREAILNAIAHRDYQDIAPMQLRLFPDRVELWNPGSIPQELITQPGISRPLNPDIARVLYMRGLVEMRGVGMLRMREAMATLGLPEPRWENRSGGVQVTLFFTGAAQNAEQEEKMPMLGERSLMYLNDSKQGDRITRDKYQERYDIMERTARNDLKRLVAFGYLRQVGAGATTSYIRTEKAAPVL